MSRLRIMLGAGGHASVIQDILLQKELSIDYVVSPEEIDATSILSGMPRFENDDEVYSFKPEEVLLINGVGVLPGSHLRSRLFNGFKEKGYMFETIIAPSAIVSGFCHLAEGVQVLAGAIVQAGANVMENVIVNTGSQIDHDCDIGKDVHIAPGAILSGGVSVAEGSHIGMSANIIQSVKIGKNCMVGAGATVFQDLPDNKKIYVAKPIII